MNEPIGREPEIEHLRRAVHAVKAPLTVIKAEVQLAARRSEAPAELAELVDEQVDRAAHALDELVPRRRS